MDKYKHQIKDYIKSMQEQGYTLDSIKQQLHNHGHAKQVVEESITELSPPKESPKQPSQGFVKRDLILAKERVFILLYIVGIIAFIFWVTDATGAQFSKVFLSFSPSLIAVFLVIIVLESQLQQFRSINWVLPIITSVIFYVLAVPSRLFDKVDVTNVTVANFIITVMFVVFMEMLVSSNSKKPVERSVKKTTTRKTTNELEMSQKAITELEMKRSFDE